MEPDEWPSPSLSDVARHQQSPQVLEMQGCLQKTSCDPGREVPGHGEKRCPLRNSAPEI